jgi:hypothetical protein
VLESVETVSALAERGDADEQQSAEAELTAGRPSAPRD